VKSLVMRTLTVVGVIFLAGCAADSLHREGVKAFERGDYETGIAKLGDAARQDPNNLIFRMDLLSRTERSVQMLLAQADAARATGDNASVEQAYRRVLRIDPSNPRAKTGMAQVAADTVHTDRVARAQKLFDKKDLDGAEIELRAVLEEDAGFVPAQTLLTKLQSTRGPVSAVPTLKTKDSRAVTLQFRDAQTKMVFEVLARQTGLNFIFDKDVKSDGKTTIFVSGVPVESAIDLILAQNQLAKQILADNMVLIYPATPTKQKEYQEEIVHSFYLANAAVKDVESLLKTVLGAKTLFVDERANLVVMRDTPEHIRMAEKLVSSIDVAEPEVILEVEVLEAANTLLDQLGIRYPSAATFTPTPLAGSSTSGTTVTTASGNSMHIADYLGQNKNTITVSQLSAGVDLLKTTGQTNVLSSPRIRAKNKEKAKIMIGDRVPVVTSGASATSGGTYSTSSVQYLEVGLNLDVTPTIHLDGNVQIKMGLEVSSIVKEFDVATGSGGQTHVYQIGTRNATTTLELKDGETQILAGLITDSDQKSSSHIPGLGDLPMLGRLFGSNGTNRSKSEIILSITPHIIRAQTRPTVDSTEFWYGTEAQTRSAPFSNLHSTSDAPTNTGASAVSGGGVSIMSAPSNVPANSNVPRALPQRIDAGVALQSPATAPAPASAPDAPATGGDTAKPVEPTAKDAAPAEHKASSDGKAHVTLDGPTTAKVGEEVNVAVHLDGATGVGKARTQLRFDPNALQVVSADAGDVAPDGQVDVRAGGIQMDSSGTQVGASGTLLSVRFKVLSARPTITVSTQVVLVGEDGGALAASQATPLAIAATP
jgi:general secretion pathway protein D